MTEDLLSGRRKPHAATSHTARWLLPLMAAVLLAAFVGFARIAPALLAPDSYDFAAYYVAARALSQGGSPYQPASMERAAREGATQIAFPRYIYPPVLAALLRPLAVLPFDTARMGWYLLNLMLLVVSVALLARRLGLRRRLLWGCLAALALFPPVYDTLLLGQVNMVLLACFTAALVLLKARPNRAAEIGAGLALGLAIAIKLFPLVLCVACVRWRHWTALGVSIVSAVLFSVVGLFWGGGPAVTVEYLTRVLPDFASSSLHNSRALYPSLLRLFTAQTVTFASFDIDNLLTVTLVPLVPLPTLGALLGRASQVVVAVVSLWCVSRRVQLEADDGIFLDAALLLCAFLLLNSVVHDHYLVLLVPAALWLVAYARRRPDRLALVGAGLFVWYAAAVAQRSWRLLLLVAPSPLFLTLTLVAVLALWIVVVSLLRAPESERTSGFSAVTARREPARTRRR
jgi:hypothetical protein